MYELTIEREISSAHFLRDYDGKCANLHGHNWKVIVKLIATELDRLGMVMDFKELKEIYEERAGELDHTNLNELVDFQELNPTAENIARCIYERLKQEQKLRQYPIKVEVWESDKCGAAYYTDPIFASQ